MDEMDEINEMDEWPYGSRRRPFLAVYLAVAPHLGKAGGAGTDPIATRAVALLRLRRSCKPATSGSAVSYCYKSAVRHRF
jgi:hypothetical protein